MLPSSRKGRLILLGGFTVLLAVGFQNCGSFDSSFESFNSNYNDDLYRSVANDFKCSEEMEPRPTDARKLIKEQYKNTVASLVRGLTSQEKSAALAETFATDLPEDGDYTFNREDNNVEPRHFLAYFNVADRFAIHFANHPAQLQKLVQHFVNLDNGNCPDFELTNPSKACIASFIKNFGLRALRRPLNPTEMSSYHSTYDSQTQGTDGITAVLFQFLLAPQFLLSIENQGPFMVTGTKVRLTGYELASKLSYQFLNSPPDEQLLRDAQTGLLDSPQTYEQVVDRLIKDPRTEGVFREFYGGWLGLNEIPNFTTADSNEFKHLAGDIRYDDALRTAMIEEIHELTNYYTWKTSGNLSDLIKSNISFARDPELMKVYGIKKPAPLTIQSTNAVRLPANQRAGVLTRAAMLISGTAYENPIKRGSHILSDFLCLPPPPPDGLGLPMDSLNPPELDENLTTRQRYEAKTSPSACQGCHRSINAIGFALNNFSALGTYRTEEAIFKNSNYLKDLPISGTVDLIAIVGQSTISKNPVSFSEAIASSMNTQKCFSKKYYAFSFGRTADYLEDGCALKNMRLRLGNPNANLQDFLKSVTLEESFLYRTIETQ